MDSKIEENVRDRFSKELKIIFLRDFADFVSINDKLLSCFCRANFMSTGSVTDENVTFGAVRGCEMNELSYRYYTTMDGMYLSLIHISEPTRP